jgi:hypothetical protein
LAEPKINSGEESDEALKEGTTSVQVFGSAIDDLMI